MPHPLWSSAASFPDTAGATLALASNEEVLWVDAAGYELARSVDEFGFYDASDIAHDYVLETEGRAKVRRVFARSGRR